MSVSSNQSDNDVQYTLENPDVSTKYTTAASIANKALEKVLESCKDGADIFELCKIGDDHITEETGKVYNKKPKKSGDDKDKKDDKADAKKIEKGIGFPTCVSVNEIAGHFSPLKGESKVVRSGDVVKVDLGVQIDGFVAQVAHTILIAPSTEDSPSATLNEAGKVSDRRADVIKAAWTAAECAARLMQPGRKNSEVTQYLQQVADEFKCQPVSGVLSHEIKRHVIDGSNCIISKENLNDEQRVDEFEFGINQAYTLDILMSSGDGKTRETECRHTVYKRAVENTYILKTAKARQFISDVNKRYPSLPFSLRNIEDEQCARVGVSEAKRHALLHEYPVLAERPGEYIAQFKFSVLLLPGGTKKITGLPFAQDELLESPYKIEDESIKKLMAQSIAPRKKRAPKAKKEKEEA